LTPSGTPSLSLTPSVTPSLSPSASPSAEQVTPLIDVSILCDDTEAILADWEETLIVKRAAITYDASGKAAQTWSTIETFAGDWQAPTGELVYNEAGEVITHDGRIYGPCGMAVEPGDRICQDDGSYMEVVYVAVHEGHTTIFVSEAERGSVSTIMRPTEALYKTEMTEDTDEILKDWYETVTIKSRAVSYDDSDEDGLGDSTFGASVSIVGDWQPITGVLPEEEGGKRPRSVAQLITRPDVNAQEDDQVIRSDGTIYYVNYVKAYEDHCTIRLKRTESQT